MSIHELVKLMFNSESSSRRPGSDLLSRESARLKLMELAGGEGGKSFLGFGVRMFGCAVIFTGTLNVGKSLRGGSFLCEFFYGFLFGLTQIESQL